MRLVQLKLDGVTSPAFQNYKVVQPYQRLRYFKAKEKKEPLSDAKRIQIEAEETKKPLSALSAKRAKKA